MNNLTTIIALCGPAGSGKSTVANYLAEKYGACRYGFATPLKELVKRALDFTDEQVYGSQAQKEEVDPRYGHSPRWFLQRIGTQGGRAVFGESFWTDQCLNMIVRQNPRLAVIEDMRFQSEASDLLDDVRVHSFVWRLHPVVDAISEAYAANAGQHASEEEWRDLDATLEFYPGIRGTERLYQMVDEAMNLVTLREAPVGLRW
jgi:septin family protein